MVDYDSKTESSKPYKMMMPMSGLADADRPTATSMRRLSPPTGAISVMTRHA